MRQSRGKGTEQKIAQEAKEKPGTVVGGGTLYHEPVLVPLDTSCLESVIGPMIRPWGDQSIRECIPGAASSQGWTRMGMSKSIDGPVAVIGDVHGQTEKLDIILQKLQALPDYRDRWIVFIGDLVDRGPDPRGAIETVLRLQQEHRRTTAVAGNHELAMAAALRVVETPGYSDWDKRWIDHYGSQQTFASYGAEFGQLDELRDKLPLDHRQFLAGLPWCVEHGDYFFVHAGLEPNSPFNVQRSILRQRDFTLNRPPWLCSKSLPFAETPQDCPFTIVSGHVPVPEVKFGLRKILIDTTGGVEGDLSCVLLPEGRVITSGHGASRGPSRRPAAPLQVKEKSGWLGLW